MGHSRTPLPAYSGPSDIKLTHLQLRCSRDVPTCRRCKDISAVCDYPPPPDRKALAAQRLQNARVRSRRESESSNSLQSQYAGPVPPTTLRERDAVLPTTETALPEAVPASKWALSEVDDPQGRGKVPEDYAAPAVPLHAVLARTSLPSPEVAAFLIEIFFQRMYNSHLLFHKGTYLADYAAGRVPDFLALSVFAVATIFLRESPNSSGGQIRQQRDVNAVDQGVSMVGNWTRQGLEWATAASQRVLMQCDIPRIETVQACQNVGLFFLCSHQGDRCHIHTVIAYKVARLLNLHVQPDSASVHDLVAAETARRCFWACWMTSCFSQDNANFKAEPFKEVVNLAFPCSEESYAAGQPVSMEAWNDSGDLVSIAEPNASKQPSMFAELIKLLHLLWEIQNFGRSHGNGNSTDPSAKFTLLLELDRRLSNVMENIHPDLKYTPGSFASSKLDPHVIFQLHAVHRLCACALHSSIVPLFSATPSNDQVSKKLLRLSAEEAVKQSEMCLDMATEFLNTRPDISCLGGVTGYGMFVASTIHFKSLVAQRKLRARGVGRLKAAVAIMERLKSYWIILNGQWSQMRSLFATAGLDINLVSSSQNSSRSGSDEQPTDLDRIVSHKGTPEESGSNDLYTYVMDQEVRVTSPQRHSDTNSIRRSSSHSASSPGGRSITSPNQEWRLPVIGNRLNPPPQSPSSDKRLYAQQPYQSIPPMPPTQLPLPQGFEQRFHNTLQKNTPSPTYLPPPFPHSSYATQQQQSSPQNPQHQQRQQQYNPPLSLPHSKASTNATTHQQQTVYHSHQPLAPLDEESYPLNHPNTNTAQLQPQQQHQQLPNLNQTQNPGYSVGGYGDPGVLALEMEIDAVNLWWDQSFGQFEMEGVQREGVGQGMGGRHGGSQEMGIQQGQQVQSQQGQYGQQMMGRSGYLDGGGGGGNAGIIGSSGGVYERY